MVPKTRAIVQQYFYGSTPSIAKNKAMATEWVEMENGTANSGIAIYAFPKIERFTSQIYFMCRGNGEHAYYPLKNARNNSSKRSVQRCIFINIPSGLYNSTTEVVVVNALAGL